MDRVSKGGSEVEVKQVTSIFKMPFNTIDFSDLVEVGVKMQKYFVKYLQID